MANRYDSDTPQEFHFGAWTASSESDSETGVSYADTICPISLNDLVDIDEISQTLNEETDFIVPSLKRAIENRNSKEELPIENNLTLGKFDPKLPFDFTQNATVLGLENTISFDVKSSESSSDSDSHNNNNNNNNKLNNSSSNNSNEIASFTSLMRMEKTFLDFHQKEFQSSSSSESDILVVTNNEEIIAPDSDSSTEAAFEEFRNSQNSNLKLKTKFNSMNNHNSGSLNVINFNNSKNNDDNNSCASVALRTNKSSDCISTNKSTNSNNIKKVFPAKNDSISLNLSSSNNSAKKDSLSSEFDNSDKPSENNLKVIDRPLQNIPLSSSFSSSSSSSSLVGGNCNDKNLQDSLSLSVICRKNKKRSFKNFQKSKNLQNKKPNSQKNGIVRKVDIKLSSSSSFSSSDLEQNANNDNYKQKIVNQRAVNSCISFDESDIGADDGNANQSISLLKVSISRPSSTPLMQNTSHVNSQKKSDINKSDNNLDIYGNKLETNKSETNKSETNKSETNKSETNKSETNNSGTNNSGTNKLETNKLETNKLETNKSGKQESGNNESRYQNSQLPRPISLEEVPKTNINATNMSKKRTVNNNVGGAFIVPNSNFTTLSQPNPPDVPKNFPSYPIIPDLNSIPTSVLIAAVPKIATFNLTKEEKNKEQQEEEEVDEIFEENEGSAYVKINEVSDLPSENVPDISFESTTEFSMKTKTEKNNATIFTGYEIVPEISKKNNNDSNNNNKNEINKKRKQNKEHSKNKVVRKYGHKNNNSSDSDSGKEKEDDNWIDDDPDNPSSLTATSINEMKEKNKDEKHQKKQIEKEKKIEKKDQELKYVKLLKEDEEKEQKANINYDKIKKENISSFFEFLCEPTNPTSHCVSLALTVNCISNVPIPSSVSRLELVISYIDQRSLPIIVNLKKKKVGFRLGKYEPANKQYLLHFPVTHLLVLSFELRGDGRRLCGTNIPLIDQRLVSTGKHYLRLLQNPTNSCEIKKSDKEPLIDINVNKLTGKDEKQIRNLPDYSLFHVFFVDSIILFRQLLDYIGNSQNIKMIVSNNINNHQNNNYDELEDKISIKKNRLNVEKLSFFSVTVLNFENMKVFSQSLADSMQRIPKDKRNDVMKLKVFLEMLKKDPIVTHPFEVPFQTSELSALNASELTLIDPFSSPIVY